MNIRHLVLVFGVALCTVPSETRMAMAQVSPPEKWYSGQACTAADENSTDVTYSNRGIWPINGVRIWCPLRLPGGWNPIIVVSNLMLYNRGGGTLTCAWKFKRNNGTTYTSSAHSWSGGSSAEYLIWGAWPYLNAPEGSLGAATFYCDGNDWVEIMSYQHTYE